MADPDATTLPLDVEFFETNEPCADSGSDSFIFSKQGILKGEVSLYN